MQVKLQKEKDVDSTFVTPEALPTVPTMDPENETDEDFRSKSKSISDQLSQVRSSQMHGLKSRPTN